MFSRKTYFGARWDVVHVIIRSFKPIAKVHVPNLRCTWWTRTSSKSPRFLFHSFSLSKYYVPQ